MILKSSIRGNGLQFADYLINSKKNERARILEISGTTNPADLSQSLFEMSVVADLTRSEKPLLQVIINPAIGEGKMMTDDDWKFCQDTIEKHIGFSGQPRAAVEHVYKDEPHVHAVWSRYDPETGKILPIDHIAHKLKAARVEIENKLGHEHLLSWQEKKQQQQMELDRQQQIEADKQRKAEKMKEFSLNLSDVETKIEPELDRFEKSRREYELRKQQSQDQGHTI